MTGILIMAVIVILVLAAVLGQSTTSMNRLYDRLAGQFGGQRHSGSWFSKPWVSFDYGGSTVVVDESSQRSGRISEPGVKIRISWPEHEARLEIYPHTRFTRAGKWLGLYSLSTGNAAFDRQFHVGGNSLEEVRSLVTPGVQVVLLRLYLMGAEQDIHVLLAGGVLLIRKRGPLREFQPLRNLTELSLELFDQLLMTRSFGMEFADSEHAGPMNCPVCGEPVDRRQAAWCRGCETPHHVDCWTYIGGCATYACGEKQYLFHTADTWRPNYKGAGKG